MDAITLLKSDHRKVERMLQRYRSANGNKAAIVRQITAELTAHMDAEERELYPVLRTALEDGPSLMEDAVKEHGEARGLLAELARGQEGSFDMDAKVATLRRAIEHHVKDEEQEIFPKMRQTLPKSRVQEIGARIARAKATAPKQPSPREAQKSPGSSVGGIVSAATDRGANLLMPPAEKPRRRAARRTVKQRPKRAAARTRTRKTTVKKIRKRARVRKSKG